MATENQGIIPLLDPKNDPGDTTANGNSSSSMSGTMKAVHYEGPFKVSVKEVDVPKIQHPDDAIIKVTTAGTSSYSIESMKPLLTEGSYLRVRPAYVSRTNGCGNGTRFWT